MDRKPNYKNWVPTGMVVGFWMGFGVCLLLAALFGGWGLTSKTIWQIVLFGVFALGAVVLLSISLYMQIWHNAFSYTGKRKLSKRIVEGVANYVELTQGQTCLDVGCGSAALTIAVAKRNPQSLVVGVDRWCKDYASFSKGLCQANAQAEGVNNVRFEKGDAVSLPFADETFDAVCSNYVYHNIRSSDRQAILMETLRTLKKGGTFAIHDLFTAQKYGDMQDFVQRLRDLGYQNVELIDTTQGLLMSEKEAKRLFLNGSAILTGTK